MTDRCPICNKDIPQRTTRPRRYCSDACKQKAYRKRYISPEIRNTALGRQLKVLNEIFIPLIQERKSK